MAQACWESYKQFLWLGHSVGAESQFKNQKLGHPECSIYIKKFGLDVEGKKATRFDAES